MKRKSQAAEWLGLLVIAFAIGVIAYVWIALNRPIDLYATVESAENKFINALHVSEEARLYIRKAAEYSLQLAVIEVSENGGFIQASEMTPLGKPYLTTRETDEFPERCPDSDRAFEIVVNPQEVSGPLKPLVDRVLENIRYNFPAKLNEYAELFSEYEVSNRVNISVYDNATAESGYKKSCLYLEEPSAEAIENAASVGATWVKLPVKWRDIQPEEDGEYNWEEIDAFYEGIYGRGIEVIPVLGWAPEWAVAEADKPLDLDRNTAPAPERINDFAKFAGELVSHLRWEEYGINYLIPWQFPNSAKEWSKAGIEPIDFARMLKLTSLEAKKAGPSLKIIFPALAPTPTCGYDRYPDDPKSFDTYLDSSVAGCGSVSTGCLGEPCLGLKYLERCSTAYMTHENIDCLPTQNVDCTRPDTPRDGSGGLMECQSSDYWMPYMYDASLRPVNYTRFRYATLSEFSFLSEMYYSGTSDYFDIIEFYATGSESPEEEFDDCNPSTPSTCSGFGRLKILKSFLLEKLEGDREIFMTADWPGVSPDSRARSFIRAAYNLAREEKIDVGPICVKEEFSGVLSSMRAEPSFSPWGELYGTANHTTRVSTIRLANQERYLSGYGLVYSEDNSTGAVGFSISEILKEARLIARHPTRTIVPNSVSCTLGPNGECISGFFKRSDADSCEIGDYICPDGNRGAITCEGQLSVPYRMSCQLKAQVYNYSCAVDSVEYPGTNLNEAIVNPNSCYEDEQTGSMGICVSNGITCHEMNPNSPDKGYGQFKWCRNINDHCCVFGYEAGKPNDPLDYEELDSPANPSDFNLCMCVSLDDIERPPHRSDINDWQGLPSGWPRGDSGHYWVNCPGGALAGQVPCCDPNDPLQPPVCNWWLGASGWSATDLSDPRLGTSYDGGSAYSAGCRNDVDVNGRSTPIEICFKGYANELAAGRPRTCPGVEGLLSEYGVYINYCLDKIPGACSIDHTKSRYYCSAGGDLQSTDCSGLSGHSCTYLVFSEPLGWHDVCSSAQEDPWYDCAITDADPGLRPEEAMHVPCGDKTQGAKGLCVNNPIVPTGSSYEIPLYKIDWSLGYLKPGRGYSEEWWQELSEVNYRDGAGVHAGERLIDVAQAEYDKIASSPESVIGMLLRAAALEGSGNFPETDELPKEFLFAIAASESMFDVCGVSTVDGGVGLFALQASQFCGNSAFLQDLPGYDPSVSYGRTNIPVKADSQGCPAETIDEDRSAIPGWSCSGGGIDSAYWRLPDVQTPMIIKILSGYYSSLSDCSGYLAYVASSHNAGAGALDEANPDGPNCGWELPVFISSSYGYDPALFTEYPAKVLAWRRVFEEAYEYFRNAGPGSQAIFDAMQVSINGRPWGNTADLPDPLSFAELGVDIFGGPDSGKLLNGCAYPRPIGVDKKCWFAPPLPTLNQAHFTGQKQLDVKLSYLDCEVTITNSRWALSTLLRENPADSTTLEGIPDEFKFGLKFAYTNRDCERGIGADVSTPAVAKIFGTGGNNQISECTLMNLPAAEIWSVDPPGVGTKKYYVPEMVPESGINSYGPGCCGYDKAEAVVGTIEFTSPLLSGANSGSSSGSTPNPGPYCNPVPSGNHAAAGSQYCAPPVARPDWHKAIDLYADEGTPVLAAQSGTISFARDDSRKSRSYVLAGSDPATMCVGQTLDTSLYTYQDSAASTNRIVIDHGDGKVTTYIHLQPGSIPEKFKQPGARVERGEVIARVGMQGIANCPHLHFTMEGERDPGDTGCEEANAAGKTCCTGETGRPTINPGPYLDNDCGTSGTYPGGSSSSSSSAGIIFNGDDALCEGDWLGGRYFGNPGVPGTGPGTPLGPIPPYPGGIPASGYANPVPNGIVTEEYCARGTHNGLDLGVAGNIEGAPIYADFDGTIIKVEDGATTNCWVDGSHAPNYDECATCHAGDWGGCLQCSKNVIIIEHPDGRRSIFYHIMPHSAEVQIGQTVHTGDPIARMGNQGCSSNVHLHYEVQNPQSGDRTCASYGFAGQGCCFGSGGGAQTIDPGHLVGLT
ncbi:MAG: M23 family metallopeptidase [archaeon]